MIEHLKSGLSISTHVGCPMRCDYCVLSVMEEFRNGPMNDQSPEEIVSRLMLGDTLFDNGKTALFINNRTDPLLPSVLDSTIKLLSLLVEIHIVSPVVLISKFAVPDRLRPFFDTLNLMYIYSYSGYRHDFNYNHLQEDIKLTTLNTPFESRFHYLRPIIPGINDDVRLIGEIVDTFDNAGFRGSIVAGIRVNKDNVGLLGHDVTYDTQHKLLSDGLFAYLCKRMIDKGRHYQVYRHTSCGFSAFMQVPNRLKYCDRPGHCSLRCENYHLCKDCPSVELSTVEAFLNSRLPFIRKWTYLNGVLRIADPVNQEHIAFIKNALGVLVTADDVCLSASEKAITSKT